MLTAPSPHSDVLVVGAGSAGSIVAEQLSADPACSVTVIEGGIGLADAALAAQAARAVQLPIGAGSRLVRRYRAELTGRPGDVVTIVRGATIGGSGAVNGGYFCRGLPDDFDWGLPGWSWPEVLESFRAIETDLDFDGLQHGDEGRIPVRRMPEIYGGTRRFIERTQESGFGWIADLNDATLTARPGAGAVPLNITADGVRTGPGRAFLLPALDRPNLTLLTETQAVRVDIRRDRAVAVEGIGPHGPIRLTADRIVLCAGAIESAHLLMLSGVGDEAMLRSVGITVRSALPVGTNCADHPEWLVATDWPGTPGRPVLEAVLHADDLEIRPYTVGFASMLGDPATTDGPQLGVALMRPRARGRMTLISDDPRVPPRIEHRYDAEPADTAALQHGMDLAAGILCRKVDSVPPGWSTSQHLCGSAPMGSDSDEVAVLDAQCRVRGMANLWVIDGSALPRIPSRGPHATIAMLAFRASAALQANPAAGSVPAGA